MPRCLYIFLDEAGDFAFSEKGTRYFIVGSITAERPFPVYPKLTELKYDLAEQGTDLDYFHASENAQAVRDQVFAIIQQHLDGIRIDTTVVEKRKTGPALQVPEKFYPRMLGYHLAFILRQYQLADFTSVIVYTDQIPIQRNREAVKKAVKQTLANALPHGLTFQVLHHDSKSNFQLQVADYCTWAVYRKWARNDERSYRLIAPAIRSEFDIFRTGTWLYY
ncbi:MAG: DUF3800 domain-containing protein [Pseudomonas sp.]|nr:DUF3800 domain-containing protein [Xanthomonadales bacterium]MDZ4324517.1 DUF3800 domain-containing protein [Pseudomonas sp.]